MRASHARERSTMTDLASPCRILVCGDLRLDALYRYHTADMAQKRRAEARQSFATLFDTLEADGVGYVLFCGNLLDAAFTTSDTVAFFLDTLKKHPRLTVVIAPGDADRNLIKPLYATNRMPENVFVFSEDGPTRFDFEDVTFYGFPSPADESAAPPAEVLSGLHAASDEKLHVLAFRGKADAPTLRAVRAFGADITAIGDFSSTAHTVYSDSPFVLSPGCAEGRSFETAGFGSTVTLSAVKAEKGFRISYTASPYATRRYVVRELSLDFCKTPSDVRKAIKDAVRDGGYGDETFLRLILTGSLPPPLLIPQISENLGLYGLRLTDATLPNADADRFRRDMSVRGELFRSLEKSFYGENALDCRTVAEGFRLGLAILDDRERE